jgi:hypothetical protein
MKRFGVFVLLLVIAISRAGGDGLATYEDPNLPGFYFKYDTDVWELEILDGMHPGQLYNIRLSHKFSDSFLNINFSLPRAMDFLDCDWAFYEGELVSISDFVLSPTGKNTYQYFVRSQFLFRSDNPDSFQKEAEDFVKYLYGDSVLSISANEIIAIGGCSDEPIYTIGSSDLIMSLVKKWNDPYYQDTSDNTVLMVITLFGSKSIHEDANTVMETLQYLKDTK